MLESRSDEMYSIQHYVIKFVNLRKVGDFLRVLRFSSTDKTELHDITEILLKVALNTITLNLDEENCFQIATNQFVCALVIKHTIQHYMEDNEHLKFFYCLCIIPMKQKTIYFTRIYIYM